MSATIVGVFKTRAAADKVMGDLRAAGYPEKDISMVARNEDGKTTRTDVHGETKAAEGAAIGAATGAVATAAIGAGIMAGVIPVIGPVLAMGPLAVTLLNAAGGAAVAGVAGALVGSGIPEEDAKFYEGELSAGKYIVTIDCDKPRDAQQLFTSNGGYSRSSTPGMTV